MFWCNLQLSQFNSNSKPMTSDSVAHLQWTNVRQSEPVFLIGEEVVNKFFLPAVASAYVAVVISLSLS